MKSIRFYARRNRSGNLLHIETDGAVVNIHVGLCDSAGNQVTAVEVIPDDERRGGDGQGRIWKAEDDVTIIRVRRQPESEEAAS